MLFPKESLSEITPEELDKLSYSDENPIIIDVRNPDEWAKEHIPNLVHFILKKVACKWLCLIVLHLPMIIGVTLH